ncbi:MAG: gamma-glutamyl-gamma-aminobutyrate hydrolase family protein [Phycisphaerales bacterium]|nr:gamma-glutamyl-gamma-aminobutyrate hydrolase family protein [Phycisphaerales bacterium]
MGRIVIGVTECEGDKYFNYANWIKQAPNRLIDVVRLSEKEKRNKELKRCNGILLTGGADVHPKFYKCPEYIKYCEKESFNLKRDEFEFKIIEFAEDNNIPILGICRGLQIYNVYKGGTLIPDLPSWGKFNHAAFIDRSDRYHGINIDPNSQLFKLTQTKRMLVNSRHHQSVDKIGAGLVAGAMSDDCVVESLERINPSTASYLSLVQWHPEIMNDQKSPLVKNIKDNFFEAIQKM